MRHRAFQAQRPRTSSILEFTPLRVNIRQPRKIILPHLPALVVSEVVVGIIVPSTSFPFPSKASRKPCCPRSRKQTLGNLPKSFRQHPVSFYLISRHRSGPCHPENLCLTPGRSSIRLVESARSFLPQNLRFVSHPAASPGKYQSAFLWLGCVLAFSVLVPAAACPSCNLNLAQCTGDTRARRIIAALSRTDKSFRAAIAFTSVHDSLIVVVQPS